MTGTNQIELAQNKIAKLFFYLQVWRTVICEDVYNLSKDTVESLRLTILNSDSLDNCDMPNFPFHITYLQTVGDASAYTNNFVGCTSDRNPNIIFMNDFIIQFFEAENLIKTIEFYGLNQSNDLEQFISTNNDSVNVKVLPNQSRLDLVGRINREEKVQKSISYFVETFAKQWFIIFGGFPK